MRKEGSSMLNNFESIIKSIKIGSRNKNMHRTYIKGIKFSANTKRERILQINSKSSNKNKALKRLI